MHIFSSTFTNILASLVFLTGDWFVAITLITLGIKILLFPLSVKQQRTQLLIFNLNQAKAILSAKFHKQTEKINTEMLKISSKYSVNPLSSLLMLVVQAPIFFSLYFSVMSMSTSVGSFLVPWISSLNSSDNLHILPVIAGLSQGLGALSGENKNFLMFLLPGAVGMVFLWKAPVALSSYWLVNSILRYAEVKIFALNFIRRKLFNVPTPEQMVKGV